MSFDRDLAEAFFRIARRKAAIMGDNQELTVETDAPGPMFVGTDIDPSQIMYLSERMTRTCLAALIIEDIEIPQALQSQWIDGFLTGLEFAKIRSEVKVGS